MTDNTPGSYTRHEKHNPAHDIDWQAVAERQEGTVGALIAELERRRAMAKLWKETTREHIGRARTALSYASAVQVARAVASVTPCSCSAQRARAEKAEKERDEALYQRDQWIRANDSTRNILDEAIEERRRIARALDLPEAVTADRMVARIEEVNGAGRTVTDEMVRRAKAELETRAGGDYYPETIEAVLTAALTEPPQRPEGAEEIESQVEAWEMREGGMSSLGPKDLRELADFLASRGVRVVGEERS